MNRGTRIFCVLLSTVLLPGAALEPCTAAAQSVPAQPAGTQAFTLEQILGAPFPSQLTAARQGSRIAWVFAQRGAQNVWEADGPDFIPRQVTHYSGDTGEPIASLRLTPDGRSVLYARGTEINDEARSANAVQNVQQPKQQVWMASVDTGEPHLLGDMGCEAEGCEDIQISPDSQRAVWEAKAELWIAALKSPSGAAHQLTNIRSSVASPQWSPDGNHLAVIIGRHDHSFAAILDLHESTLDQVHILAPSTDRDLDPQWSPDGSQVTFLRVGGIEQRRAIIPQHPAPWSLWVADAHTYAAQAIFRSGSTLRDSLPLFAPDLLLFAGGGRIVFSSEADGHNHLYTIASSGGAAALLTPGDYDVEQATLTPDKATVLLASNEEDVDRRHIWQVPAAGGKKPEALATGDTIEWLPVVTGNGKDIFCLGSTATTPGLVHKLSGGTRQLVTTQALPADFPNSTQLVIPQQVIFKSTDGLTIHGQLFVPKGRRQPGPALIFTHGGPYRQMLLGFHYMDYYSNAYASNQYLASLGFTVLSVNYRLGVMYGSDFREVPHAGWRGAAEYQDVIAGAHYLQALPGVDPKRIGLWGGSYGGYLTALALARNSDIFAAGVDFHGVHDWTDFLPDWEEGEATASDLKEAQALALSSSPNASIDTWKSPVLLIQGDDDRNVAFSQTVSLVQKLRSHNVPFEEIIYPDEIHDFLLWKDFVRSYSATAQFLQQHLEPTGGTTH